MTINLHRLPLLILTIILSTLFLLTNRLDKIRRSTFATGKVMGTKTTYNKKKGGDYKFHRLITFKAGSDSYSFYGGDYIGASKGESVRVIYETDNPQHASVYNFDLFWLIPILYGTIPIVVVCILVFSFMSRWDKFVINTKNGISYSRISKRLDPEIEQL
jgi:hypothetical protein